MVIGAKMRSAIFLSLFIFLSVAYIVTCCNEAVCASLVSKCQLMKSCDCDMSDKKNCSCCNNCQLCLAHLYSECCSCVDMCPHPDPEDSIFKTSAIEVMTDPIPELFNVLTEEEDYLKRWTTHKYPVYFDSLYTKLSNTKDLDHDYSEGGLDVSHNTKNCTVAFMSKCMSMNKCKQSCKSMGAAKYRWFQNEGCCQCIGDMCIDYGLNEPMCLLCREDVENEDSSLEQKESEIKKDEETIEKESDDTV